MNNEYTCKFIQGFFSLIEAKELKYCILRGYESLPEQAGRDIDIFIEDNDSKRMIEECINACGWSYSKIRDMDSALTYICYYKNSDSVSVIQLDFWTSLNWRGIKWCSQEAVLSDRRKVNGFWVATYGVEAVITSMKELMGGGIVKEKYYKTIQEYALKDKIHFINCLRPIFGDYSEQLFSYVSCHEFDKMDKSSGLLKKKLIKKYPFVYLKNSFIRARMLVKSFIRPRGKLVAFVGPDGSGKTTILEKEANYLKPFYSGVKIYHIRYNILPDLSTGHGFSSMKGKIAPESDDKKNRNTPCKPKRSMFSILTSLFVVFYYTLDFILGNFIIARLRRKNILIMYDRYYYDHFIQSTTRELIYPIRHVLLKLVKTPDVVIHLNADENVVYARKKELNIAEIKKQNECIQRILRDVKNAYTVDTNTKNVDIISKEVFDLLIHNLHIV